MTYWKSQEYAIRDRFRKYFPDDELERVPGSGAGQLIKGDVAGKHDRFPFFIDNKSTRAKASITIKKDDLTKARKQAGKKIPLQTFRFFRDDTVYVIMDLDDMLEMASRVPRDHYDR